jgi:hypothetical protein
MSIYNTAAVCPRYAALCALTLSLPLTATLASASTAPTISGAPATSVVVNHRYSFQPRAGGAADTRRFSITNKPRWATFRPGTGELYGTPHQIGTFRGVTICVERAKMKRCLRAFSLKVLQPNTALVIRGTPAATAMVGSAYSFQPTAHDPDGLKVTFSVVDKPSWLRFNANTGRLSGTPAAADVRDYARIDIIASNGHRTARLPSFSITVDSQGSELPPANVTIAWTPPTENTNGSALTNLVGYHLYYGTTQADLTKVVDITNPGVASYMVSDLSAGTWYFALTSVNAVGVESVRSSVISTVVE